MWTVDGNASRGNDDDTDEDIGPRPEMHRDSAHTAYGAPGTHDGAHAHAAPHHGPKGTRHTASNTNHDDDDDDDDDDTGMAIHVQVLRNVPVPR